MFINFDCQGKVKYVWALLVYAMVISGPHSSSEVAEVMTSEFQTITTDVNIVDAARTMSQLNLGSLIVTNEEEEILGVLSERDITRKIVGEGRNPRKTLVRDVMSAPAVCVQRENTLDMVIRKMIEYNFRRLPVLSGEVIVGVISQTDLLALYPSLVPSYQWN